MNKIETLDWLAKLPPCDTRLAGRDIVVLGHQRWDAHFTVLHGTTLRLAQQNRVLFMEPPDSAASILHHRGARAALGRMFNRLELCGKSLGIYHVPPLFLPFQPYSRAILRSIEWTFLRMVRDGIRRMGLSDPLFWVYQFNTARVVEKLDPPLVVYECIEEAAGFTRSPRKQAYVRDLDAQLCRRADVVFVPNAPMLTARRPLARAIHVFPWPVDFDHYHQAAHPALQVPEDLARIAPPIIGFYGNLDPCRFDIELVHTLAQRRPRWNFALIGPFWQGFEPGPLRRCPNVHFLGPKPLRDLPAYLKGFAVGIIPYGLNEFTRSITPLKLMEYLATGKPVVTTPLPAALPLGHVLRVAADADEFEAQIAAALADPEAGRDQRLSVAREADWRSCMQQKADIVLRLLETGHAPTRTPATAGVV